MSDTPSVYRHYPCQTDEEHREPLSSALDRRESPSPTRGIGAGLRDGKENKKKREKEREGGGGLTEQKRKNWEFPIYLNALD